MNIEKKGGGNKRRYRPVWVDRMVTKPYYCYLHNGRGSGKLPD